MIPIHPELQAVGLIWAMLAIVTAVTWSVTRVVPIIRRHLAPRWRIQKTRRTGVTQAWAVLRWRRRRWTHVATYPTWRQALSHTQSSRSRGLYSCRCGCFREQCPESPQISR